MLNRMAPISNSKRKTRKLECSFVTVLFYLETNLIIYNDFSIISDNLRHLENFPSQSEVEKLAGSDKKEGRCL